MEFKDLVRRRRSCRAYADTAVSDAQLTAVLGAAAWAPSPLNLQPWQFIIIKDPVTKKRIREAGEEARRSVVDQSGPAWAGKYAMNFISEAPVLIAVVVDPTKGGLGDFFGQRHGALQAASACIQNMLLAAADQGLGSLWFTFFSPEKVKAVLGVPDNLELAGIVPLGKPNGGLKPPPRKELVVYRDKYGDTDA
jgi:nitroreductase